MNEAPVYLSGWERTGARNLPVSVMSMSGRSESSFQGTVNTRTPLGFYKIDEKAGQALRAGCLGSCVRTDHLGLEPAGHVLHVEGRHVKRALDG